MERGILTLIKYLERYSPLFLFIVGFCISLLLLDINDIKNFILNTNGDFLTVFMTLGGFLLTIYTIIQSIDNRIMKILKETDNYSRLIRYLNQAVISDFFVVFLIILILFIKYTDSSFPIIDNISDQLVSFYVAYLIFTIAVNVRIIYFIGTIFPYSNKSGGD